MECTKCGREFSRADALKRHQGSGACVMSQVAAVATRHTPPPPPPPRSELPVLLPPPTTREVVTTLPGVGEVVQRPDGTWMTREAQELYQRQELVAPAPAMPIPWKKYAVIAGIGLVLVAGIYMAVNAGRRPAAGVAPVAMPRLNGMENFIPPALMSLVAFVFLSKMLRGEFTGWNKILKELAK